MRDWEKWVRENLSLPVMNDLRDQRIAAELAAHLEETCARLSPTARARGKLSASPPQTRRSRAGDSGVARRRAPPRGVAGRAAGRATEEGLRAKGTRWIPLADLLHEFRLSLRTLARRPFFAASVVLVLAFGIGATTTVFTLLDAVILSPLPFPDAGPAGRDHAHIAQDRGRHTRDVRAWHLTYEDENRVFEDLGMFSRLARRPPSRTGPARGRFR